MALVTAHHLYLRPGELARIRWEWIVPAAAGSREVGKQISIVLHPSEELVASKVVVFDETLLVDQPELTQILESLRQRHASGPFLPVDSRTLNK